MKKYLGAGFLALGLVALPFGSVGAQTLTDSPHDFTSNVGQSIFTTAAGQCITCHTPHTSTALGLLGPLWGHDTTAVAAAGWTMYSSSTMDATEPSQPGGVSLACLSCHDGTVALDAFGGSAGTPAFVIPPASGAYLGNDLSNDHPISILYDAGGAEFNAAIGGLVGSLPLYGAATNQVECGSCHNPHDYTTVVGSAFLRQTEAAICTTCHVK